MSATQFAWFRIIVLIALLVPLVACGNDEEEVANEREEVPELSPEASDELPEGVETLTVEIEGGVFTVDEIVLQRGEPTELQIVNRDDTDYEFGIEDLVTAQEIPAGQTDEIGFTTPDADTFTGELRDPEEGSVISELRVDVTAAGGTS